MAAMLLLAGAVLIAIVIGYLTGGRLKNLGGYVLKWWWLALGGLLLQLVPYPESFPDWMAIAALLLSFAMLLVFAWVNRRKAGFVVILFGLALNTLVIAVNQGMPVTHEALVNSDQEDLLDYLIKHGGAKHHLATDNDKLLALGDVIGIPKPFGQAISIGDVFVYVGLIVAIAGAMRERSGATEPARPPEPGSPPADPPSPGPPPRRPEPTNRGTPPTP
jgi:hypothetical protein